MLLQSSGSTFPLLIYSVMPQGLGFFDNEVSNFLFLKEILIKIDNLISLVFLCIATNKFTENSRFNHIKKKCIQFTCILKKSKGTALAIFPISPTVFMTRSRLENDQLTCPYRLTTSLYRIINRSFKNVLDTKVTNCFKVQLDILSVQTVQSVQ